MTPIETKDAIKPLTPKEIEDVDKAICVIYKQSAKVPFKLPITGKPMPDNSEKQPKTTSL